MHNDPLTLPTGNCPQARENSLFTQKFTQQPVFGYTTIHIGLVILL